MREQEIRNGQGRDPTSQGKFRNELRGPQIMSFGCPEFFEVIPLAACRNPEQYNWKFPG